MTSPQNNQVRFMRWLVAGCLFVFCGTLYGQGPALPNVPGPGIPQSAGEALNAASGTPGLTINTGGPCCKPPTIWDFLGCGQIKEHLASTSAAIHELPLIKNLGPMFNSVLSTVGLANPAGPPGVLPGAPGPPAPPGAPQGPGAVAAKIEADKKAAEDIIQNLNYLAQQDCNRYPEVIPAILQELDNPDELVRYTALTALKPQCRDFRCSTLPATRIYFRLKHSRLCKPCGCCEGCQCQDQVIARLTSLLLDKDALNHPMEKSFRVRSLATEILNGCLGNRGRDATPKRNEVQPDPDRGPLPDPQQQVTPLLPVEDTEFNSRLSMNPAVDRLSTTDTDEKALLQANSDTHQSGIRQANYDKVTTGASTSNSSPQDVDQLSVPGAVTVEDRGESELALEQLAIVERCEQDLKLMAAKGTDTSSAEFEESFSRLCNARLELALLGNHQQETILLRAAERVCQTSSHSVPSVILMATACQLAASRSVEQGPDQNEWIQRRSDYLNFVARNLKVKSKVVEQQLVETAELCRKWGLTEAHQSCVETIDSCFKGDRSTGSADNQDESVKELRTSLRQPNKTYNLRPESYSVRAFPKRESASGEPVRKGGYAQVRMQQTSMTDDSIDTGVQTSVPSGEGVDRPCQDCQTTTVTFFPLANSLTQEPASSDVSPPTEETPSPEALFGNPDSGNTVAQSEINSPYFSTKPLPQDVYDRALEAISVGPEAMGFPECDPDVLKMYDNSSAIRLAPFALFNMDSAQTGNVFRLSYRPVFGYKAPDRAEYFWSKIGGSGPPLPEKKINFQDFTIYNENGSDTTSVFTEIPIRFLDPERNGNTAGPGDLVMGVKTVMLQDPNYRIASIVRTSVPIGSASRGLGHGFLTIEPGLLSMWRIGRQTHLFGDLQFQFPIGGDSQFGSQVLRTSIGLTRVLWSDVVSPPQPSSEGLILTVETIFTSFLGGSETTSTGLIRGAEQVAVTQHVGLRRMWSERFSTGIDLGFGAPSNGLYDFSFLTQAQWVY